jgi:Zn-dependent protease
VVLLANDNVTWKRASTPARPLEADPDDLGGALAARRELGIEAEQALVEGFLHRVGQAIDSRVDERLAQQRPAPSWPRPEPDRRRNTGPRLTLAICSMVLGIPLSGIGAAFKGGTGLAVVVVVWSAIVAINVVFNRSSR